MKILHIRFCNLNSLLGSWFIDLTRSEYSEDGIFAITGPTGAGKTTILDGVCLALYGRTPRLKNISKSSNEIMSRQSGECWAEVEFSTSKGRYRCHWAQHRARKSADGDLQQPRHEIVDCSNGKPLETKIKLVAQKVVEVTGMNYDQFTRSIMLAQGDFNAFLKANPDERAPILEQITGTDIYSRISIKVHEQKGIEQQRLELINKECEGFTPLSDQEVAKITTLLNTHSQTALSTEKEIASTLGLLDWYTTQERLQLEVASRTELLTAQMREFEKLEPQRQLLVLADKAKLLENDYNRLSEQRALQQKAISGLADSTNTLKQLAMELQKTADATTRSEGKFLAVKKEASQQELLLKQVRSLDQEIHSVTRQKNELEKTHSNEVKTAQELAQSCTTITTLLGDIEITIKELSNYQHEHQHDKQLVEEYSGIIQQLEHLMELNTRDQALGQEIPVLQTAIIDLEKQLADKRLHVSSLKNRQLDLENTTKETAKKINSLLNGNSTEQLFTRDSRIQEQLFLLEQAHSHTTLKDKLKNELQRLLTEEQNTLATLKDLQNSYQQRAEECQGRKKALEKQHQIVQLATKVKDLEQQRSLLRDGEPCPLCGSVSHPYSTTDFPAVSLEQLQLETEQKQLEDAQDRLTKIQTSLATVQARREQITDKQSEKNEQIENIDAECTNICNTLGISADDELINKLQQHRSDLAKALTQLRATRAQVDTLKAIQEKTAASLATLSQESTIAEQELQKIQNDQEKLQTQLLQKTSEQQQLEKELRIKKAKLEEQLLPYATEPLSIKEYDTFIEQLGTRRTLWLECTKRSEQLSTTLQEKRSELTSQKLLLERQQKLCREQQASLTVLMESLAAVSAKRHQLFGNKDADIAEQQMKEQLLKNETDLARLRNHLNNLQQQHAALTERVTTLNQQIVERAIVLEELNRKFTTALQQAQCIDEEAFIKNRMDQERYTAVSLTIQQHQKACDETRALLRSATEKLQEEQEKDITKALPEELRLTLNNLREQLSSQQQEAGALKQQLRDNERQHQLHKGKIDQLTAQRMELERWSRLHELIGSNDGKKFRNFAQGLTFEVMISHANTSLQKMSDRYLLVRDPAQPLELHVIDNYQAGQVRSTKNLSGGESFIVSMALALGLSTMASHNVQVDSLFLDEGFGTLDEEALQTALDTLSGLHQQGKLIGIISHVGGLQERIATRISIIPGIGGISTINGPGAGRWQSNI